MRKKERIYLFVFIALFVTYVATDFMAPEPIDWRVSFDPRDKNPFGGYILNDRATDLFSNGFEVSHQTISQMEDKNSIIIFSENADISGNDFKELVSKVESGANVWISANSFSEKLQDSLRFNVSYSYQMLDQNIFEAPTSTLSISDSTSYTYPSNLIANFFELENEEDWDILAKVGEYPVAIKRAFGKGTIQMNSVPYIFTNFGLLVNENYQAVATLLSYLPTDEVHYTMFYHAGRGEATTPLRFFLRQSSLRWSLYLALFLIIIFLLVSSNRRQRAIPVMLPPQNSTVHYVKTLGTLFYREKDHKKAATKIINNFVGGVRNRYFISVDFSERFYKLLSSKSGVSVENVIHTFELITKVKGSSIVEEKVLIELTKKIELFK